MLSVNQDEAAAPVESDSGTYPEIWRSNPTSRFVGLRVDMAAVTRDRLAELVDHTLRAMAPKRLVAAYDAAL